MCHCFVIDRVWQLKEAISCTKCSVRCVVWGNVRSFSLPHVWGRCSVVLSVCVRRIELLITQHSDILFRLTKPRSNMLYTASSQQLQFVIQCMQYVTLWLHVSTVNGHHQDIKEHIVWGTLNKCSLYYYIEVVFWRYIIYSKGKAVPLQARGAQRVPGS